MIKVRVETNEMESVRTIQRSMKQRWEVNGKEEIKKREGEREQGKKERKKIKGERNNKYLCQFYVKLTI
jgi:hypothetical protein